MSRSNELYQQVILDHNKHPRNFRVLTDAPLICEGHNPLCGDNITIYLEVDSGENISDVSFQGTG